MALYKTKAHQLKATRYPDLIKEVRYIYHEIERRTRRKPYLRSAYFKREKIFFDYYWRHLDQKSPLERRKRLAYFKCGLELIAHSRFAPTTKPNPNRKNELLHHFGGVTPNNELFLVQIKEDLKTNHKYLMSIYAPENKKSPAT